MELTQEYLKNILHYDLETGNFIWKYRNDRTKHWNDKFAGTIAGGIASNGRSNKVQIEISGSRYYAHRLAFLYMLGKWPDDLVDHKDGDGLNNRWDNLREATPQQNNANTERTKHGVYHRDGKYIVLIRINDVLYYLGSYDTEDEALEIYINKHREVHGEFSFYNREVG